MTTTNWKPDVCNCHILYKDGQPEFVKPCELHSEMTVTEAVEDIKELARAEEARIAEEELKLLPEEIKVLEEEKEKLEERITLAKQALEDNG